MFHLTTCRRRSLHIFFSYWICCACGVNYKSLFDYFIGIVLNCLLPRGVVIFFSLLILTLSSPLVFSVYRHHSFFISASRLCDGHFISGKQSCPLTFKFNYYFVIMWTCFSLSILLWSEDLPICKSLSSTS